MYLFEENESKKLKFITLRIINLTFKAVGVLRLVNMTNNNILFQNCHFENVFTTHDIIPIESHPSEIPHGLVSFHFCQFRSNVASRTISVLKSNSIFHKDNFKSNKRRFPHAAEIGKLQFREYVAKAMGRAVYVSGNSVVKIMDCSFVGNQAVLGGRFTGGAVFTSVKKIVIKSTFFENNTAAAGAVSVDDNSEVQILNWSFKGNNAKYFSGGAIHTRGQKLAIKFYLNTILLD